MILRGRPSSRDRHAKIIPLRQTSCYRAPSRNLTKAHARYLESRFIALAQQAGRCRLDNGTAPPLLPLPEADAGRFQDH
jgi:hypothetical protein